MEQTPNTPPMDEQEPLIPPQIMLILAAVGLVIALVVVFTQREFTLIGWGGLGLMVIALAAWTMMAPDRARAILTGRMARFGGTAVIVTVIFLVALAVVYAFVRGRDNWRWDLTQRNEYSLTTSARQAVAKLGADPTKPQVKIIAFYGVNQAGRRDRDLVLYDDYATTSGGKVSYEIVDPDRYPERAKQYGDAKAGDVKVFRVKEDGQLDTENPEAVSPFTQEELTNAILRASSSGDFRAYVLTVQGGLKVDDTDLAGLSILRDTLASNKWKMEQATFFDLAGATAKFNLSDPAADGTVLIIPGGDSPLPDDQLKFITDWVDKGGDLVILSAFGLDGPTLATADNLSTYLYDKFGLRVNNDLVLDPTSSLQDPRVVIASDLAAGNFVTTNLGSSVALLMDRTHSIDINPTPPSNVTVTPLLKTTSGAFSKTDFSALASGQPLDKADSDPSGPFVLAATAENTETGARLVVFGSQYVGVNRDDGLRVLGIENLRAMLLATVWAANFDTFVQDIPQIATEFRPQDVPIFALDNELSTINLMTIVLLPIGVLAIGLWVWWRGREREAAR